MTVKDGESGVPGTRERPVTAPARSSAPTDRLVRLKVDDPLWDRFVSTRQESLAFHLPAWTRTLSQTYGFESFCLAHQRADGSISAGIPVVATRRRRWVSLPFTDVCPPLGDSPDVSRLLSDTASLAAADGVRSLEVRSAVEGAAATVSHGFLHELELVTDADALLPTFSKSQVQRNIARARREGVVVRRADSPEGLLDVFLGLYTLTRRRLGLPIQPLRFFEHLWNLVIAPGHGFVLISYVGDAPAAAAVFLLGEKTVTYKYGASDTAYWPQRPNHLLFWEAIKWSCDNGYRSFDFGRTNRDHAGLRAFKQGWGTTEHELSYSVFGTPPLEVPEWALSLLRPVIHHSPKWVTRSLGKLLYRFAA